MKAKSDGRESRLTDVFDALGGRHRDIAMHLGKLMAFVVQLQVTAPDEEGRGEARELIAFFSGPARDHNYDEERHVFPSLLACEDVALKLATETLSEDHAWIEFRWLDIEPFLVAAAAGEASNDLPALRAAAEAFVTITRDHMALEEALLFPQLRGRLKPAALRSMSRDMAARRSAGRRENPC